MAMTQRHSSRFREAVRRREDRPIVTIQKVGATEPAVGRPNSDRKSDLSWDFLPSFQEGEKR